MQGEAEAEISQVIIEFDCLIFRHSDEQFVAILDDLGSQRIHVTGSSKLLTKVAEVTRTPRRLGVLSLF